MSEANNRNVSAAYEIVTLSNYYRSIKGFLVYLGLHQVPYLKIASPNSYANCLIIHHLNRIRA